MSTDDEIQQLSAAVATYPDVIELRLRLIRLLTVHGRTAHALVQAGEAMRLAPDNADVRAAAVQVGTALSGGQPIADETPSPATGFDWSKAEAEVEGIVSPRYVGETAPAGERADTGATDTRVQRPADAGRDPGSATKLDDVAGMDEVKSQIERSFIGPLRNPELARAYGTSAGGGLLLYGPPGCGKTFIASAIAGELGAHFYPVGVPDVVEMATGETEQTLQALFAAARQTAPSVVFFDEIDAIGQKRSQLRGASMLRQLVTRLLTELDSSRNDGVFVLGATNHPWDVDAALRRPGRLDRMLFVSPPDDAARAALIYANFAGRPIAGIDVTEMVAATAGYSGADVAFLCRSAAQHAMTESVASGQPRYITMADVRAASRMITPSTGSWFAMARNVIEFGNRDGAFDDLADYLKRMRRGGR